MHLTRKTAPTTRASYGPNQTPLQLLNQHYKNLQKYQYEWVVVAMGSSYGVFMLACIPGLIMTLMLNPVAWVDAAIPCPPGVKDHINRKLTPCRSFLLGQQNKPPPACCTGVKGLNAEYKTATDRQRACSCLKASFAKHQPAFRLSFAQRLPGECNANIRNTIIANFDCSRWASSLHFLLPFEGKTICFF